MYAYGPQRSAIPRVVGILALVFAPIGIFFSLVFVAGPVGDHSSVPSEWTALVTWLWVTFVASIVLFGLHLTGGILAVMYKRAAPLLMSLYGILGILLALGRVAVPFALMPKDVGGHSSLMEDFVYMQIGYGVLAVIWPIIALALMNTRSSKTACSGQPSAQQVAGVFG